MGTKIETEIEYGKMYQDVNTGLIGIAMTITKWQYGCIRVGLQQKMKDDGTIPDAVWVDEYALKGVESAKVERGGPTPNPKREGY